MAVHPGQAETEMNAWATAERQIEDGASVHEVPMFFPLVTLLATCWTGHVREDLEAHRALLSWSRLAEDGECWRDTIQQILGHTQQSAG